MPLTQIADVLWDNDRTEAELEADLALGQVGCVASDTGNYVQKLNDGTILKILAGHEAIVTHVTDWTTFKAALKAKPELIVATADITVPHQATPTPEPQLYVDQSDKIFIGNLLFDVGGSTIGREYFYGSNVTPRTVKHYGMMKLSGDIALSSMSTSMTFHDSTEGQLDWYVDKMICTEANPSGDAKLHINKITSDGSQSTLSSDIALWQESWSDFDVESHRYGVMPFGTGSQAEVNTHFQKQLNNGTYIYTVPQYSSNLSGTFEMGGFDYVFNGVDTPRVPNTQTGYLTLSNVTFNNDRSAGFYPGSLIFKHPVLATGILSCKWVGPDAKFTHEFKCASLVLTDQSIYVRHLSGDTLTLDNTTIVYETIDDGLVITPVNGGVAVKETWWSDDTLSDKLDIPITNTSGAELKIGQVVYPDGAAGAKYASSHTTNESKVVAVVGGTIPNGQPGVLKKFGEIEGSLSDPFDLTGKGLVAGDFLYLSDALPSTGDLVSSPPNDGSYTCLIGVVEVVDAIYSKIFVDISVSELTSEVTDTNGFPPTEKAQITLSATDNTPPAEGDKRILTITPDGPQFHFYEIGKKYDVEGADSVQFTDQEGEHWFYYQDGVLTHYYEPTLPTRKEIILNYAFVCAVYWDATNKKIIGDIQMEMHGISMSPETHLYLHLTRGAQFVEGYGIGDLVVEGDGSLDTHAQYSVAAGMYFDEDITHIYAGQAVPATMPVLYNLGALATIREGTQAGFGVLNAPSGRLYYNQDVGGTWQLTEVANGDYVLYHIFGFNGQDVNCVAIMGQNDYINLTTAREGANQEISNLVSQLPFPEMIPVGTIIYRTGNAGGTNYTNAVKAIIVSSDAGDYVDWRTTELAQGTAPSSHANLTNVEEAGAGVSQGHINDQAQTIAGVKTFSDGATTGQTAEENVSAGDQGLLSIGGGKLFMYGSTDDAMTLLSTTTGWSPTGGINDRQLRYRINESGAVAVFGILDYSGTAISGVTQLTNDGALTGMLYSPANILPPNFVSSIYVAGDGNLYITNVPASTTSISTLQIYVLFQPVNKDTLV